MQPIRFDQTTLTDFDRSSKLEWLETNGLGGFASSTVIGLHTRRYHALLTAALHPPAGRAALLSTVEETLVVEGRRHDLSTHRYPGVVHPRGYQSLREFRLDPFPVTVWQVEGLELERRLFLVQGEDTIVIEYELRALDRDPVPDVTLELRPLVAYRDYHSTAHANGHINPELREAAGCFTIAPYEGMPALHFAHNASAVEAAGNWYYSFEYDVERERGLDYQEDLFNYAVLRYDLNRAATATLIVSTTRADAAQAAELRELEIARRAAVAAAAASADPLVQQLTSAASQYVVRRGELHSVIAGYPWFADWGRDTMIALPGLSLVTGRQEVARDVLLAFAASVDQGMLPNRFPDAGETPEYNTVDATLWFFEAIRSYLHYTGDYELARAKLYPVLKDILQWHLRGTRYGIVVDGDGLLLAGEPGVQLTWMDAKIGDWVVTPRHGKPVEAQALWYNALRITADLAERFGDEPAALFLTELASLARDSFNRLFWNGERQCLYDVVGPSGADASIRPNQIFAVSLPHTMLPPQRAARVVEVVRRELLTPLGLRSLAPSEPGYRPRYEGGVFERDSAYHQGTVWPWLLGPFITAWLCVEGGTNEAKQQARAWLSAIAGHCFEAGVGHISEIADAEAPHVARGCFAQAWSVSEILRALVEDVLAAPPESGRDAVAAAFSSTPA